MQKLAGIVLFLLCLAFGARAQIKTDSLHRLLKPGLSSIEKAKIYNRIAFTYLLNEEGKADIDSAILYAHKSQELLADISGSPEADTVMAHAVFYDLQSNSSIENTKEIGILIERLEPLINLLSPRRTFGARMTATSYYPYINRYDLAVQASEKGLELARRSGKKMWEAEMLLASMNIYQVPGRDPNEAERKKLIEMAERAVMLTKTEPDNARLLMWGLQKLCSIYSQNNDSKDVLRVYADINKVVRENNMPEGSAFIVYYAVAEAHYQLGHKKLAHAYADSSVSYGRASGMGQVLTITYRVMSDWDTTEHNLNAALAHIDSAFKYSNNTGFFDYSNNLLHKREVLVKAGRYYEAMQVMEKLMDTTLSEKTVQNELIVNEYAVRVKVKEKELEALAYKEKLREQELRSYILYILLAGATLAGGFVWVNRRNRLKLVSAERALAVKERDTMELELANERLKAESLRASQELITEKQRLTQTELEFKNARLAALTAYSVQKSEIMGKLKDAVLEVTLTQDKLKQIVSDINESIDMDSEWEEFRLHFSEVHPRFFEKMQGIAPDLTQYDLKMAAYLAMNLSTKQIARLLGISEAGVFNARYRLRTKLGLQREEDLFNYLSAL
ncbi:MAG: hypothetical protein V4543_09975 [Bacteroidota bacterium]